MVQVDTGVVCTCSRLPNPHVRATIIATFSENSKDILQYQAEVASGHFTGFPSAATRMELQLGFQGIGSSLSWASSLQ